MSFLAIQSVESLSPKNDDKVRLVEFTVNPETGPFLVSSYDSFLWVQAGKQSQIRAAVRAIPDTGVDGLLRDVVDVIADTSVRSQWESIFPLTTEGMKAARERLTSYDFEDHVAFAGQGVDPTVLQGVTHSTVPWMREGQVLVVPSDPEFVGFLVQSKGRFLAVVHNPSRTFSVLR
jgi:hypothetical protein